METTVACVYWKGKFRGRENCYSGEWVSRMKKMVERNLDIPHRFVCLSNVDVPCERIELKFPDVWIGWWAKMELFRPGIFQYGKILYLDLDLIIMKDLTPFFKLPEKFYMTKKMRGNGMLRRGEVGHIFNSGTMVWQADCDVSLDIYRRFVKEPVHHMSNFRGDQDFLSAFYPRIPTYPQKWTTKLRFCPDEGKVPDDKAILIHCMPQKNDKASEVFPWVREVWMS